MHVQVNGRYLVQRLTGQQRYAHEIVSRLQNRLDIIAPPAKSRGMGGHLWEQLALPRRLGRDLLWSPSTTGPLSVKRQVVTIHDCAFFDQANCFSRAFAAWYQFLVPRLARAARRIIAVSEFSKQRIVELCRVPAEKVSVIYSGVGNQFRPHSVDEIAAVRTKLALPQRYILCVGSLEPRKNLGRLLQAWQRVQPRLAGLSLVLVGAKSHVFRDAGLSESPPGVHLAGYLDDELLPAVYAGAELFVYPSIYEGFGLPVIEAMASGAPVITSNVTALPEVAGDAAAFVDPLHVDSIAAGIETLAQNEQQKSELRQKGIIRAAQFNWENTARETWRVLEAAA
ncbi:MAG TPA: glycosyltransferase family 1 protein [Pirellulaceae bacterium]|jgi:glycosyltransferase involved in cell wall biosynthesis